MNVAVGYVFVGMNHVKTLLGTTPGNTTGVPAEPELIQPTRSDGQLGHRDVLEQRRRLVKALRHHRDVAFAQHRRCHRHGQRFSTTANF